LAPGEFVEVFVDTPIDVCIARDVKGLYAKAQRGEIKHFTGIDSPYEVPESAELTLKTVGHDAVGLAEQVVAYLRKVEIVP
jgi:bifunctional enzyme CysN/CysC